MAEMRRAKAVFVGPHGWRAGWRFLLFFTIALVCAQALAGAIRYAGGYQERPGEWSAGGLLMDAALTLVAVVVGMAVMAHLERRSLAGYGLPRRAGSAVRFGEGMLWGFAASTIVLLMIFHAMWNYAAMVLYAAPNTGNGGRRVPGHLLDVAYEGPAWLTGGVCGIEASIFTFMALAAMSALFTRRRPRAGATSAS